MCDHQESASCHRHQIKSKAHDSIPAFPVEIAGRLISKDKIGAHGKGPPDGDALLLPPRKLFGITIQQIGQAETVYKFILPRGIVVPGDAGLKSEIGIDREAGDEIELLEDQPYPRPPQPRPPHIVEAGYVNLSEMNGPPIHRIQTRHQMQQRRFSRPGLAHQGQALTHPHIQIDPAQHMQRPLWRLVGFLKIAYGEHEGEAIARDHIVDEQTGDRAMTMPLQEFRDVVGDGHVLTGEAVTGRNAGYCAEALDAGVIVRPGDAEELAQICKLARARGVALVPQGGLTGLVDGTASHIGQAILSFERMTAIERIDPVQGIAIVGAGVTLTALQTALEPHGLVCGVDIAARGSCTLGGMVSTNAGGARVLRYGMMRQNVLGLEVVLADGTVLDMTSPLIKNNAGYDLKQMFIGSEGTLGLVTKIVLKLWPAPKGTACALVACAGEEALGDLFAHTRDGLGGGLSAFEAMWRDYYALTTGQPGYGPPPLTTTHPVYAIIEASAETDEAAHEALLAALTPALDTGLAAEAVIARSEAERRTIWRAREDSDAVVHGYAANLSYDIGLELADIGSFVADIDARLGADFSGVSAYLFGHVGDGNLHVMLGLTDAQFAARRGFDDLIYDTVARYPRSTVSAEHGIGLEKRDYLDRSITPEMLAVMKTLKGALDPVNILNPGKVFA